MKNSYRLYRRKGIYTFTMPPLESTRVWGLATRKRPSALRYPERFAMVNLGHDSKAIDRAYAKKARVVCPSLESVEQDFKAQKIVRFTAEEAA